MDGEGILTHKLIVRIVYLVLKITIKLTNKKGRISGLFYLKLSRRYKPVLKFF